jgi:hypothetical protein
MAFGKGPQLLPTPSDLTDWSPLKSFTFILTHKLLSTSYSNKISSNTFTTTRVAGAEHLTNFIPAII